MSAWGGQSGRVLSPHLSRRGAVLPRVNVKDVVARPQDRGFRTDLACAPPSHWGAAQRADPGGIDPIGRPARGAHRGDPAREVGQATGHPDHRALSGPDVARDRVGADGRGQPLRWEGTKRTERCRPGNGTRRRGIEASNSGRGGQEPGRTGRHRGTSQRATGSPGQGIAVIVSARVLEALGIFVPL